MFEIGRSLRTAREHQQRDLAEVERATHIRATYLAALEDERFDALPGTAYAKGFLRTYADYLGLDGSQFVDEFNERFAPTELPEAAPPARVEIPRQLGTRLLLIPLAAGIGLLVWQLASGGGNSHQRASFIPPVRHVHPTTAATPTPSRPPRRPARARVTLVATRGPCWLSVRADSQSGRVLYERELQPGQRAGFAGARLWLRIGAPSNVDASLDGKPVALPSAVSDLIVTPRGIRRA